MSGVGGEPLEDPRHSKLTPSHFPPLNDENFPNFRVSAAAFSCSYPPIRLLDLVGPAPRAKVCAERVESDLVHSDFRLPVATPLHDLHI